jgi:uncharacterized protein with NRDE domain
MCLIVFAWQVVPGVPLLAAANRDEFYDRPAAPAGWWEDYPEIYAGRDLQAGGTWLGISRSGKFAALTNFRGPSERRADAPSRGALVSAFLTSRATPGQYAAEIEARSEAFNGFNLLLGDGKSLVWFSNRSGGDPRNGQPLQPGIYGLSNGLLDSPWPKVVRTKAQFGSLLCQGAPEEAYFDMLADTSRPSDCRLPKTGVNLEWERLLSAVCIESPDYGTRCSTVVRLRSDNTAALNERILR